MHNHAGWYDLTLKCSTKFIDKNRLKPWDWYALRNAYVSRKFYEKYFIQIGPLYTISYVKIFLEERLVDDVVDIVMSFIF